MGAKTKSEPYQEKMLPQGREEPEKGVPREKGEMGRVGAELQLQAQEKDRNVKWKLKNWVNRMD